MNSGLNHTITGANTSGGEATLSFIGSAAEGAISTYTLIDNTDSTNVVNGTAILQKN